MEKRNDGYYVLLPDTEPLGPHERAHAIEIRDGLQRTYDNIDDWSFFTCEKPKTK